MGKPMEWGVQQAAVLEQIYEWYKNPRKRVFKLHGYAGTGKTTLLRTACEIAPVVAYGAPTGKAALRMRMSGCHGASTIHSLLYEIVDPLAQPLEWRLRKELGTDGAKLVGLDEGSMIPEDIGRDLEDVCPKLIVLADPFQLPPVGGPGYFTSNPDAMLTEIRRQAEGNPIIKMSMDVREGRGLRNGAYGDSIVADRYDLDKDALYDADIVICGTNRMRHNLNNRIRARQGWDRPDRPQIGDRVICRRNNRKAGLLNGSMWDVQAVDHLKKAQRVMLWLKSADDAEDLSIRQVEVPLEFFEGVEDGLRRDYRLRYDEFAYGRAITCHAAQGSQWDNVYVVDESNVFRENADRWLYTALTRASWRVSVAR